MEISKQQQNRNWITNVSLTLVESKNGRHIAARHHYAGDLSFSNYVQTMLYIADFTGCKK